MLNNRQNGRRRGRGRSPNPGQRGNESRIDSRARGNAPQMLEKYKNMARDAQMSGDRVMTEYYLQFSDHYFRIVAETRSRMEEQQQPRRSRDDWQEEGDEGDDMQMRGQDDGGDDYQDEAPRDRDRNRNQGRNDGRNEGRGDRSEPRGNARTEDRSDSNGEARGEPRGDARNEGRAERPRREPRREPRAPRPRDDDRDGNVFEQPMGVADGVPVNAPTGIDIAVLPPALGVVSDPIRDLDEEPAPAPRKRGRPRKVVAEDATAEG